MTYAQRHRRRARLAPRDRPWGISATPTSRTIRSGSSGPTAPPAAGSPISPRSSAATCTRRSRSPRTRWRQNQILGLTWDEIDAGRRRHPALDQRVRRRSCGGYSPHLARLIVRLGLARRRCPPLPRPASASPPPPRDPRALRMALAVRAPSARPRGRTSSTSPTTHGCRRTAASILGLTCAKCPRAGRHAPDRTQEPRHLRPLQHHQ